MKVFAVGTSCTWFERNNTSFILDDKILLDTPSGSYKDIVRKVDIFKLDGIVISHFHADHFGDFPVFATRFMRESEKRGRTEKLKVYGPKGIFEKLLSLNILLGGGEDECDEKQLKRNIDFIEVFDGDEFELSGYKNPFLASAILCFLEYIIVLTIKITNPNPSNINLASNSLLAAKFKYELIALVSTTEKVVPINPTHTLPTVAKTAVVLL